MKKSLRASPVAVSGLPGVACRVALRHAMVGVVFLHLPAGQAGASKREVQLKEAAALAVSVSRTALVVGDLNLPDNELFELSRSKVGLFSSARGPGFKDAAYTGHSWNPQANR